MIASVVLCSDAWNQVYHLTPSQRVTARDAALAMQRSLIKHFRGVRVAEPTVESQVSQPVKSDDDLSNTASTTDWSVLGREFSKQVSTYQAYWRDDPIFDARNRTQFVEVQARADLDCPILDDEVLERLCDFAIQAGFGWPKPRIQPQSDSFVRWLEERSIGAGIVAGGLIQLNAMGPGGGSFTLGLDSHGVLVFENADSMELPRVIFGLAQLREHKTFSALEASGKAWIQLPKPLNPSAGSLTEDLDAVRRLLVQVALTVSAPVAEALT
jgi:hypothetical protein